MGSCCPEGRRGARPKLFGRRGVPRQVVPWNIIAVPTPTHSRAKKRFQKWMPVFSQYINICIYILLDLLFFSKIYSRFFFKIRAAVHFNRLLVICEALVLGRMPTKCFQILIRISRVIQAASWSIFTYIWSEPDAVWILTAINTISRVWLEFSGTMVHHHVLHSGLEFAACWQPLHASEQKVEIALLNVQTPC